MDENEALVSENLEDPEFCNKTFQVWWIRSLKPIHEWSVWTEELVSGEPTTGFESQTDHNLVLQGFTG